RARSAGVLAVERRAEPRGTRAGGGGRAGTSRASDRACREPGAGGGERAHSRGGAALGGRAESARAHESSGTEAGGAPRALRARGRSAGGGRAYRGPWLGREPGAPAEVR